MLKHLTVDNFKSLNDFTIDLDRLTIVIGDNTTGKSSILQAIAFLKAFCVSSITEYLQTRSVKVEEIVSRVPGPVKRIINFSAEFEFDEESLTWNISLMTEKTKNFLYVREEKVTKTTDGNTQTLLSYSYKTGEPNFRYNERTGENEPIAVGIYNASQIAFLPKNASYNFEHLNRIKKFFENCEPLDLLTPRNMKKSARGYSRALGTNGEKLPALINNLTSREHEELRNNLSQMLPHFHDVHSVVQGVPGWAHLESEEIYENKIITVNANGLSDGTLRLLALVSLPFLKKKCGITLLDEVEDGINAGNLEFLTELFKKYSEKQQLLITTHSTVLLDFIDPENIRYIYRNENGGTVCKAFNSSQEVQKKLDYLYPGEILLNTSKDELRKSMIEGNINDD